MEVGKVVVCLGERSLEALFERFLSTKIFKNRDVLSHTYVPDELPHRDEQIEKVGLILASALKGGTPSNVFIYGKTGTGKTAVVRFVLKHLVAKCHELNVPAPLPAYLNCRIVNTNYRVLARLCSYLGVEVPFTGLPTDEVYSRFRDVLDSRDVLMIIVLDEVERLVERDGSNVLYDLTRMNHTVLKRARVSIIGITNDLTFKDNLDPRVLSSLGEEELVFPPYTAAELRDILWQRAQLAFREGALEGPGVINLCAAIAAKEHGDARRALDLLRVAGEIAEREGAEKVSEEHVRAAQHVIERDHLVEALRTLPMHSKLVLYTIFELTKQGRGKARTGDIYNYYLNVCRRLHVEPLTQRRVSSLINELDMLGVVAAHLKSRGRHGLSKEVKLNVSVNQVKQVLEEDSFIKKLSSSDSSPLFEASPQ